MNKLLLNIVFALFLGVSTAHAISIPEAEDAANGPAVWLVPVYNNSGSTLNVGDVVIWDIDSSTNDVSNYVTTTTTADTVIVAGVVYKSSIAAANTGTIAVHGVVPVNMASGGNAVKGPVCSSTTAAKAAPCATTGNRFGHVVTAVSSGSANVFLEGLQ